MIGLAIFSILLSFGHVNYDQTMTFNKDRSVTYSESLSISDYADNNLNLDILNDETNKKYKISGITVKLDNNKYTFTKRYESIDDLATEIDTSCDLNLIKNKVDNQYCFKKEKGLFYTTYHAKINNKELKDNIQYGKKDPIIVELEDGSTIEIDYSSYKDNTQVLYQVKMPYKILSTNADNIDKNTLTWNLINKKPTSEYFEYSFKVPNRLNIIMAIIVGIIVVFLFISVIISLIINRPKKEKPLETLSEVKEENIPQEDNQLVNALLSPDGNDVNNLNK